MTAPYQTLRERLAAAEARIAELENNPERDWWHLKHGLACIALEELPPDYPVAALEAWGEVISRLRSEGILFQFAPSWLIAQGYRVTRVGENDQQG